MQERKIDLFQVDKYCMSLNSSAVSGSRGFSTAHVRPAFPAIRPNLAARASSHDTSSHLGVQFAPVDNGNLDRRSPSA